MEWFELYPTLSTWRFGLKKNWCHGRHVSHPSWRQALWWRLARMLCNRDSGGQVWKDRCSWVVKGLTHLNAHQKADLLWVLQENNKMFDGTLGVHPHKKVHINIDSNAKPVNSRPYPVPWIHLITFKMELNHLVRIGVLASQQESEWASPHSSFP